MPGPSVVYQGWWDTSWGSQQQRRCCGKR